MSGQPYYQDESVTLHHRDALTTLRTLPDASIRALAADEGERTGA